MRDGGNSREAERHDGREGAPLAAAIILSYRPANTGSTAAIEVSHMLTRRRFLKYALAAGAMTAAGAAMLFPRRANAYYSGPVSDHFDGQRFFNPGGRSPKGLANVARLYGLESWERWPGHFPSPHRDTPPAAVSGTKARIAHIGHASWLIQTAGRNILVDPVWSKRASPLSFTGPRRAQAPGIDFDALPTIHTVLVTHNHYDHMDTETLARLWQRYRPRVVAPLGNDIIMQEDIPGISVETVDWGAALDLGRDLRLHVEPTQHWSARGALDRNHALWASYVLETPAGRIFAVGDSGLGDGRTFRSVAQRHPSIRMALLPIGAYEPRWFMESQHMNPADAVTAFELSGAHEALGHHWGTFQLTTEAHDQPPADLAKALAVRGVEPRRFRPVQPGMVVLI